MDEKDVTLFVNCRNEIIAEKIMEIMENLLEKMNFKYKRFKFFNVIKVQLEDSYEFFVRIVNLEKDDKKFINAKYEISDIEIIEFIKNNKENDNRKFLEFMFGNFLRGVY